MISYRYLISLLYAASTQTPDGVCHLLLSVTPLQVCVTNLLYSVVVGRLDVLVLSSNFRQKPRPGGSVGLRTKHRPELASNLVQSAREMQIQSVRY